jgi:hypothetical protein
MKKEDCFYVYTHRRLDNLSVFYVGMSQTLNYQRAYFKFRENLEWHSIIKQTNYIVEIIYENLSEAVAEELEEFLIETYGREDLKLGTLVNKTNGGKGINGFIFTDKSKKVMSEKAKGNKKNFGTLYSDEVKTKISKIKKEYYKNTISHREGVPHSQETKEKISNANKGKPAKNKRAVKLLNKENEVLGRWESLVEASSFFNISVGTIANNLSGLSKCTKQGIWKYE